MLKTLATSSVYRRNKPAPYIRISGQWLRDAGIEIGTRISVQVNAAGVLITPAPPEPRYNVQTYGAPAPEKEVTHERRVKHLYNSHYS